MIAAFQSSNVDIPGPRDKVTVGGVPLPLTENEQRRWNEIRGDILIRSLGPMAQNGSLDRLPPTARDQLLQKMLDSAARQADARVFAEMSGPDRSRRLNEAVTTKLKPAS